MQIFHKGKSQLTSAATDRLQKLLAGRAEHSVEPEPRQILVTPPPQAVNPILKLVMIAVLITAGLVWLNRPAPVTVPEVARPGIPLATTSGTDIPIQSFDQIVVDVKGDVH